jgi:protoheme IX farnesyltransferase
MSGWIYLASALALDAMFLYYAVRIYAAYSDRLAQQTFRFSVVYLALLFTALLLDHYV